MVLREVREGSSLYRRLGRRVLRSCNRVLTPQVTKLCGDGYPLERQRSTPAGLLSRSAGSADIPREPQSGTWQRPVRFGGARGERSHRNKGPDRCSISSSISYTLGTGERRPAGHLDRPPSAGASFFRGPQNIGRPKPILLEYYTLEPINPAY